MNDAKEFAANAYRSSLFSLCAVGLGYHDVNYRTHGRTIAKLDGKVNPRKLICLPRGCLKSSIACVGFPIWLLINNPNLRILIDSELYTNSKTFLREIRSHLENPRLTEIFGQFRGNPWSESEITILQRTLMKKEASITVGGIGTTKVGQHYDVVIMDDMNSPKNSTTIEQAEKVISHYRYNMSILDPGGTLVLIGTRYAANDLIGHVIANEIDPAGLLA